MLNIDLMTSLIFDQFSNRLEKHEKPKMYNKESHKSYYMKVKIWRFIFKVFIMIERIHKDQLWMITFLLVNLIAITIILKILLY